MSGGTSWSRLVELLDETNGDERTAVVNQMRVAHGLPVVGHGLTYDFKKAMDSVRAYRARWDTA